MNTEQVEALTVWATTSLPRPRLAPYGSLAIHKSITGKNGRDHGGLRRRPNKLLARPQRRRPGPRIRSQTAGGSAREFSTPQANGV